METKQYGLFRGQSSKGKGYWLARWRENEKIFYDGPYGTMLAAKNAAQKWYDEISNAKAEYEFGDRVNEFIRWLETKKEQMGEELYEEVESNATRILFGTGEIDPSLPRRTL